VENYFYCYEDGGKREFRAERFLADLESASSEVMKAAQRGILPIGLHDRYLLTGYVAMSFVRTPVAKKLIDQAAIANSVQAIRDLVNDPIRFSEYCKEEERRTGTKHDPEEERRKLRAGRVRGIQTNRAWSIKRMVELMLHFQELFMGMRLRVLHANQAHFLTSDCPVRVNDPAVPCPLPKSYEWVDLLFPLNRELCLAGSYSGETARLELMRDQVADVNRILISEADRFVYAPFDDGYITADLQKLSAERAAIREDKAIQF
jgi:hypothetical protein